MKEFWLSTTNKVLGSDIFFSRFHVLFVFYLGRTIRVKKKIHHSILMQLLKTILSRCATHPNMFTNKTAFKNKMRNLWPKLYFLWLKVCTSVSLQLIQQWTMTIVDRSSEKPDHESVGCKQSPFTSGDGGMDGGCSSSWAVGPTMPSDSPRLKAQGGCLGPAPGAVIYNTTPPCVDRPKEQGRIY